MDAINAWSSVMRLSRRNLSSGVKVLASFSYAQGPARRDTHDTIFLYLSLVSFSSAFRNDTLVWTGMFLAGGAVVHWDDATTVNMVYCDQTATYSGYQ